jgi:hypothetical protein
MMEKIAVFAPIPSASVRTATDVKTGVRASERPHTVANVAREILEPRQPSLVGERVHRL